MTMSFSESSLRVETSLRNQRPNRHGPTIPNGPVCGEWTIGAEDVGTCSDRWRGFGDVSDDRTGSVGGGEVTESSPPRHVVRSSPLSILIGSLSRYNGGREANQYNVPPSGTSPSGETSTGYPSSLGTPTVSASDLNPAIRTDPELRHLR